MKKYIFYCFISFILLACDKSDLLDESGKLVLQTQGLSKLVSGYEYRIWLATGDFHVLAGSFNIQSDGVTQAPTLFQNIDAADLQSADSIYITIDKTSGLGINKKFIIMAGAFNGNSFSLQSTDSKTILNDFSGQFQLKTPTTTSTTDELSGIWYYNTANSPLLNLSTKVSSPFIYQSWLQSTINGKIEYLNMGRFTTNSSFDTSNSYSSTENTAQKFPGEDFIKNINGLATTFPLNLENSTLLIEAIPEDYESDTSPFGFIILSKNIGSGLLSNTNYTLSKSTFSATGYRK